MGEGHRVEGGYTAGRGRAAARRGEQFYPLDASASSPVIRTVRRRLTGKGREGEGRE